MFFRNRPIETISVLQDSAIETISVLSGHILNVSRLLAFLLRTTPLDYVDLSLSGRGIVFPGSRGALSC